MNKKPKTVRQVLVAARAEQDKRGFCGDRLIDSRGRVCPIGAFLYAGAAGRGNRAIRAFAIAVGGDILSWVQDPRRTKRQVLAAFDRAIGAAGKR